MLKRLTSLCFFLAISNSASAQDTHGSAGQNDPDTGTGTVSGSAAGSDSNGNAGANGGGGSLVLPGQGSRAGKAAGKADAKHGKGEGDGKEAPPANGAPKDLSEDNLKAPPPYPLFIVGVGPTRKDSKNDAEGAEFLVAFTDIVQKAVPGARVLAVRPLTLTGLQNAWKDGVKKGLVDRIPSSAILILSAGTAVGYRGDFSLFTDSGPATEAQLVKSVQELDLAIFGKAASSFEKRARLNTAVLTSYAGSLDCAQFPAGLFGVTSNNQQLNPAALMSWLPHLKKRLDFPMDARGWFDAWELATKLDADRGFFCPTKNGKGYLGKKLTSKKDPY